MLTAMNLLWLPLTLICALSAATSDALIKKALAARHNEFLIVWFRLLMVVPVVLACYAVTPGPSPGGSFYRAALGALPLELVALFLYVRALKHSPLGLTVPFLSLTPLFLLLVPALILGERVSVPGGIGVALIAAGSYCLNLKSLRGGLLAPFGAILRERGSLMMAGVSLIACGGT